MSRNYLFTSESVSKGHPDKVADQISDAILDEYLKQDNNSKVACEVLVTTNFVLISGEINSRAKVEVENIVRKTIKEIGYDIEGINFHYDTCEIINKLHQQSPDINQGVDLKDGQIGAGDQGIMFGYANNETENYMPLTLELSNLILKELETLRKEDNFAMNHLRPDAKSQVSINYENNKAQSIDTILISTQHSDNVELNDVRDWVKNTLIPIVINKSKKEDLFNDYKLLVNPTGKFVVGGPDGDTGLTGRKIVVDQYGGRCPVGGGAFSGKDPSKVDRSAAYVSRWLAKNIVASGLANECLIQLSYAIGVPEPISVYVETYNTGKVEDQITEQYIKDNISLTPKSIIDRLNLRNVEYLPTASYGHFGRKSTETKFTWEELNLVENFKKLMNK